jgi:hypothetical protein
MVGDGSFIPITSVGSAPGPFCLRHVLIAPKMVHNLLSIRQFTADNSCSIEFDSSGLTMKDSTFGCPLLRCDSLGPLYTLGIPASAIPPSHSAALATTPTSLPGTVGSVTPAVTCWLSSAAVHTFLALRLLVGTRASMRASLVAMFAFLFLLCV